MYHVLTLIAVLVAAAPASAHGIHAAAVDGHDHGALVAALIVLPVLATLLVALVSRFRR